MEGLLFGWKDLYSCTLLSFFVAFDPTKLCLAFHSFQLVTHVWVFLECECLVHFHPTSIISDHRPHTSHIYLYLCWRLSIMPEYAEHFVVLFLCRKNMSKFKKSIVSHLSLLPGLIFGKIDKIKPKNILGEKQASKSVSSSSWSFVLLTKQKMRVPVNKAGKRILLYASLIFTLP